jgi:hypothetical protein
MYIEGVLAYFTRLKCQKRIGDDVGDIKYVFTKQNFFCFLLWKYVLSTPYSARIWLQMP